MKTITEILAIATLCVFVIDLSGFVQNAKDALGRWLRIKVGSLKPFDCSLCSTWWLGLLWIACTHQFTLVNVFLVAMAAFSTPLIAEVLMSIKEAFLAVLRLFNRLIDKI